jgi:hypothetical protein
MVETYNYDPADYPGPPHAVFYEDIQKLFGNLINYTFYLNLYFWEK